MHQDVIDNYFALLKRIRSAEMKYHRDLNSVSCLAVSKGAPVDSLLSLIHVGQQAFGENYLAEALTKMSALSEKNVEWHFIGRIQTNKCKAIAHNFSWVHTLCRPKEADQLSKYRGLRALTPLQVCIQVKLDNSPVKEGIMAPELFDFADYVSKLPHLKLRGLMGLPAKLDDFQAQRDAFRGLKSLGLSLVAKGIKLDTYSMGMTHDLEAAISEGATLVRIGQGIFGPRKVQS